MKKGEKELSEKENLESQKAKLFGDVSAQQNNLHELKEENDVESNAEFISHKSIRPKRNN